MPTRVTTVNLAAVRVGITETRTWWRLPVLGQHILIAGATGAGKGSVLWSLIAGLAPHVKTGRVRLCVIDPKGGMELGLAPRCSPSSATTPATPPSNCCASWWQ
ncbi:ftsK/SpoIIIE family protein [Mycobacterium xenopi 3993]|nr:ftsK/SpoIIIE family protein [Mycobacterium xenopi 3993]